MTRHEQISLNWKLVKRGLILVRWGLRGILRAISIDNDTRRLDTCSMSRENNERLWQVLVAVVTLIVGICGWYMNRLSGAVDRTNEQIQTLSVQMGRVEERVAGIEKRLDQSFAVGPTRLSDFASAGQPEAKGARN